VTFFRTKYVFVVLGLGLAVIYNHCSGVHSMGGQGLSSMGIYAQCVQIKEASFVQNYHPWLKSNCAACHAQGGSGNGAFADELPNIAFQAFDLRGAELINDRALDPNHQPGFTGPQHEAELAPLTANWENVELQYDTCVAQVDANGGAPIDPLLPQNAEFFTVGKTVVSSIEPNRISWDLETELETSGAPSLPGVTFSLDMRTGTTDTGSSFYEFSTPRLETGASNVRIAVMEVRINGQLQRDATTFKGINTTVESNSSRDLTLTTMVLPMITRPADTVSVGFGIIEETTEAPIAPGAVRFSSLVGPGGVFANNCVGCHNAGNAQGGLNIENYQQLVNTGYVTPGDLQSSLLYQRMRDGANPMPPRGILNDAQLMFVENWILDGAAQ
jgi:mono/diheme cytochrome c family protein